MVDLEKMTGGELTQYIDELFNDQRITTVETLYAALQVVADEMNVRGKRIAKKYGKHYRNLTPRDLTFNRDAQMVRFK